MLTVEQIEQCVIWACEKEVSAPKPGNVNCFSGGHNMQIEDFINSAHAIAPVLARTDLSVGQIILQSIIATRTVVNCNTNLGIVLLFAPLCKAIQNCDEIDHLPIELEKVLNNLSIQDAIDCYQGIRLAEAGGLGNSEQQDINEEPSITLKEAMFLAKDYDSIAAQYINNYHDIWQTGLPNLTSAINCGESVVWASAFAYLNLLSALPDTLICRKKGLECAQEIQRKAGKIIDFSLEINQLSSFELDVISWDNELKQKAINPGTTADLTAATLLIRAFGQALS
ncbi:MAG: triphosphoribosyl-dephospho-CoA synthase [Piscirickettsiaceae bacterium]|nr:triphosphoribosyl-dephospho-CoA synthase [Piscirickettsiaceae bacterium]